MHISSQKLIYDVTVSVSSSRSQKGRVTIGCSWTRSVDGNYEGCLENDVNNKREKEGM